ncbi:hypothetical protein SKAU_G00143210 [Synaphobranchus kaupii]|uniref:Uncharacterized protein n=1 Tax=Synaphobranchus kaupii TaxID=118154 RepID=A0A9Q1FTL1_SYNKA|nr:hypothetical protein SKAU_G00143210 [Synaphobranchus kaupii]
MTCSVRQKRAPPVEPRNGHATAQRSDLRSSARTPANAPYLMPLSQRVKSIVTCGSVSPPARGGWGMSVGFDGRAWALREMAVPLPGWQKRERGSPGSSRWRPGKSVLLA